MEEEFDPILERRAREAKETKTRNLTVAAVVLGVSKDWLKDRRENGTLHYSMVGNTAFYIKSEIDRLIRENAVTGTNIFKNTR